MGCFGSWSGEGSQPAMPRPPSPPGSWQSPPSPPRTRAHGQATSQEAVTADRLENEAPISYLIEDFIDKSHFTIRCWTGRRISQDRRARATAVSRPSPCPLLGGAEQAALPALRKGSGGVRHSVGTKGKGRLGRPQEQAAHHQLLTLQTASPLKSTATAVFRRVTQAPGTGPRPTGSSALLLLQHLHIHAK